MDPKRASKLWPWLLCVSLIFFSAAVGFAEEEKRDDSKSKEKSEQKADKEEDDQEEVKVFTNEDLEKLTGPAGPIIMPMPPREESAEGATQAEEGVPTEAGAQPGVRVAEPSPAVQQDQPQDPLQWMEQRQQRQAEHQRQLVEAEHAVASAKQKVADLENRLRATRIPFLARPKIPEDEQEAWSEKSAPQRVEHTQAQLDAARAELDQAEQALAQLRAQAP
jgi:hypothetical protein